MRHEKRNANGPDSLAFVLMALLLGAGVCRAQSYTYYVDEDINGVFTVTGTVTTDTLGVISSSADIIDEDLTLTDQDSGPYYLNASTTTYISVPTDDLSATATQLLFNFSGGDTGQFVIGTGTVGEPDAYGWIVQASFNVGSMVLQPGSEGSYSPSTFVSTTQPLLGDTAIGTIVTTVPEPGTLLMLGTGLLGLAGAFQRKFRSSALPISARPSQGVGA